MTKFNGVDVDIGNGLSLFIDGNSKITRGNGSFTTPAPNALSLPHVSSCPGATPTCAGSCYVHGLRRAQPELWAKYAANRATLDQIFEGSMLALMSKAEARAVFTLGAWIGQHCRGGFRWHVSGDLISAMHLGWIDYVSDVASVKCWLYTRSFAELLQWHSHDRIVTSYLTINLSADRDNYAQALVVHRETDYRICYLVDDSGAVPDDLPDGSVLFPDYALRGRDLERPTTATWWQGLSERQRRMVCPADFFGQSELRRCGPCSKCLH